jgi:hypothetical protein
MTTPLTTDQINALPIGAEVAIARSGSWNPVYLTGCLITKRTPAGRITVAKKLQGVQDVVVTFDRDGSEYGREYPGSSRRWLVSADQVRADQVRNEKIATACSAVRAVRYDNSSNCSSKTTLLAEIAELEKKLAAARDAVNSLDA